MDQRAGPGLGQLVEPAVALVGGMGGVVRGPARSPDRSATDARSVPRRSHRATIAGLLMVAAAVTALSGCAPTTLQTTGAPGPAAPAPSAAPSPASPPTQTPALGPVVSVLYADGRAITKTGTVTVDLGSPVTVRVVSDVADEVHLHGYDRLVDAAPGREVDLSFTADTPGVFEVELENAQAKLIEFEVV